MTFATRVPSFKTIAQATLVRLVAALFVLALSQAPSLAATLTFNRAYQGGLSGQTFTTTTLLTADAGSIRFSDNGNQRSFQNTSGTLYYTVGGVAHSETGVLNSRYPNGNTQMNAVAFSGTGGDRLLVLSGSYTNSSSYSGSSNAIVTKLNEYIDATAPDPSQTTLLVNGGSSATASVGGTATLVVTVKLSSGTAVSGATVSIAGSPSGGSSISPSSTTTNASGQASFTVQGLQSGTVTYTATASANGTTTTSAGTVSVTYVGVRNAGQSTASVPSGTAGQATTVVITVRDAGGTVMTGASGGLAVTIGGTNAGATPSAITDNGNGTYSVTYTPTAAGTDTVAITLDGTAISGSPYSSVVAAALTAPTITTTTLPTPVLGQAYSQTVATTGGTAPVTFAVTTGALPTGLTLNASTGTISGTATAAGAYSFTITATGANSLSSNQAYSGTIAAAVAITTTSLPTPVLGQAYSQTVATSDGTAPMTFAVNTGSLPTGLTLNASTGVLSGTATAAGAYSFAITATDANGLTDAETYSGTISAGVVITTASLPTPVLGQVYSQTVSTNGGTAPVTFAVATGALPTGLSLNASTGVIGGTATAAGTYSFAVTATDANDLTDAETYSGTIAGAVAINTTSLPTPVLGQAYSQTVSTTGGTAPVTFAVTTGALPTGLSLNTSTGAISGTATAAGAYTFAIMATDANGLTDAKTYSGTISAGVVITTTSLPAPVLGQAYSQTIATTGGTAAVTFAVTTGAPPTGLSFNASTGVISGTATAPGGYSFAVTATDANSLTDAKTYSGTIAAGVAITTTSLPTPVLGQAYSQTVAATGGTAPVTFAVTTGALPTGLSLNASIGVISGTVTAAGAYSFTITATDANGLADAKTYSGAIIPLLLPPSAAAVSISVAANSTGTLVAPALSGGTAASVAISSQASRGTATSSGLSITYTPAPGFSGADSFTYTATNATGTSPPALVTIAVSAPTLIIAPTGALPGGTVGVIYAQTLSASGGTGPYVYAVSGGVLPAGLAVDPATGAVSGTPTTAGSYMFDIVVTDSNGATGTAAYTIVIAPAALTAPNAGAVSITVAANSAGNPVAPALSGGAAASIAIADQPAHGAATVSGLSIAYTPAAGFSGADSFTYTAANAAGVSPAAVVTVTVTAPTLVLTPVGGLPDGVAEAAYAQTVTVSGGAAPYHFALTSGALPRGLTLNAVSGAITGTPATAGSYGFQVTATDANGATGAAVYRVTIAPAPPVAADSTSATVPANTQTQAGQNVSLNLSTLVTGDVTEVRIVTPPQHGTVTLSQTLAMRGGGGLFMMAMSGLSTPSQFVAVYTPDKDFQGVDSFAFVAVGPGGVSAPAVATINVVGRPPTAKALTAATTDGKTVSVELTTGATEGPFTGATLGAVTPADAATVALVQGGTASARTFRLDVTPKVRFGGTIKINYTLTNVFGDSSTATVTLQVTARPNPAADPVVQAISDAQGEAARRFAQAQVDNFMRRAESLHGADCLASGSGVTLSAVDMDRTGDPRGRVGGPAPGGANRASDGSNGDAASNAEASAAARGCRPGDASVWTGGAISLSTRDASGDASKIRATSSGLSLGVDKRVSERASVGVGVGYGEERSRVGGDAGRVSAQSTVVAAYGSLAPADGLFIDGMVARGWLDFDTRRLDTTSGLTTLGARDGRFTVAALSAGLDRRSGGLSWSPYGRLEYLSGSLDAYREQGAGVYDLRFDRRWLRSTLGVLGLRAAYERPTVAGILTTSLRAEWRHEFSGGSRQGVDYADVPGAAYYSLPALGWSRERLLIEPGLGLLLPSGWELGLDAGLRLSDSESTTQARVEAKKRF